MSPKSLRLLFRPQELFEEVGHHVMAGTQKRSKVSQKDNSQVSTSIANGPGEPGSSANEDAGNGAKQNPPKSDAPKNANTTEANKFKENLAKAKESYKLSPSKSGEKELVTKDKRGCC